MYLFCKFWLLKYKIEDQESISSVVLFHFYQNLFCCSQNIFGRLIKLIKWQDCKKSSHFVPKTSMVNKKYLAIKTITK